jgi:hypothetical protein
VKKITQKNDLLWCKLTDERIQYFKISGIYLLRYGDAVTAKIPLFTNVKISDEERFFSSASRWLFGAAATAADGLG